MKRPITKFMMADALKRFGYFKNWSINQILKQYTWDELWDCYNSIPC